MRKLVFFVPIVLISITTKEFGKTICFNDEHWWKALSPIWDILEGFLNVIFSNDYVQPSKICAQICDIFEGIVTSKDEHPLKALHPIDVLVEF